MAEDFYRTLGVERDATQEEIKKAYRRMAKRFHPDRNRNRRAEAEERMKTINVAYETLSDPLKRRDYDAGLNSGFGGGGFRPGSSAERPRTSRGRAEPRERRDSGTARARKADSASEDVELDYELTLEQAFAGVTLRFSYNRRERCPSCRGTGKLFGRACSRCGGSGETVVRVRVERAVPRGVADGMRLRLSGAGHYVRERRAYGNLYLTIHLRPHEIFTRRGDDLHCEVWIPFELARDGGRITVPLIDGGKMYFRIRPGTRSGLVLEAEGQGMPVRGELPRRGDLCVHVSVEDEPEHEEPEAEEEEEHEAPPPRGAGTPSGNESPKLQAVYTYLAATLGWLGAHNFYAGRYKSAVAELLALVVLTSCFGGVAAIVLFLIFWFFMVCEGCTVETDGNDRKMRGDGACGCSWALATAVALAVVGCSVAVF